MIGLSWKLLEADQNIALRVMLKSHGSLIALLGYADSTFSKDNMIYSFLAT